MIKKSKRSIVEATAGVINSDRTDSPPSARELKDIAAEAISEGVMERLVDAGDGEIPQDRHGK